MNSLKKYNLSLFLTEASSLFKLDKNGLLEREIAPLKILAQNFNKIFIFSYGRHSELNYQKNLPENILIKYRPLPIPSSFYKYLLPFFYLSIIRQSDFLRTNQIHGAIPALIAKYLNKKAKLIIRTGYTQSLFDKQAGLDNSQSLKLEKKAYQKCDIGLVTSKEDKEYLIKTHQIPETKIKVIANYIDTDIFKPDNQPKYFDRLIFIGRAGDPQKNISSLLKALHNTNLSLDIIGRPKNVENIQNQAKELNVSLNFLGIIPNQKIPKILNQYSIFILPSLYEGMPKSLLEAMSCSLACIATDVPGSREIITDKQNGLLTKTDSKSLKQAILKLISSYELQKTLGQNARQFVIENFSLKTQIQKEIGVYQNLLNV